MIASGGVASGGRRIVGREHERERIALVVARANEESSVLTFVGEPGSGKTTLLESAVGQAVEDGAVLLVCAPTEAEVALPWAALGDLLAPVTDLSCLSAPLRHALERALLRDAADVGAHGEAAPFDARNVGQAVAQLLTVLAASNAVVMVIDDLQWLDAASSAALVFAARRLPPSGVAVVGAQRPIANGALLPGDIVDLEPLSDASIESIVGERTHRAARSVPLRRRRQMVEAAGGNPLFAIELARAEVDAPSGTHAVPATLSALLSERFGHLDGDQAAALASIALLGRTDLATARRLGIIDHITQAERDGVLDTSTGRIVFTHPLFAAATIDRLLPMTRRAVHRQLADVVDDPAESARHAALASEGPEPALAASLMEHAEALAGRAALEHACDLATLAVGVTPADDPARPEYCVRAADLAFRSGDTDQAARLLAEIGQGDERSEALRVSELLLRSRIAFETGQGRADLLAADALEHCASDHERVEALSVLARVTYDDFDLAARRAAEALDLAERTHVPPAMMASALIAFADANMIAGGGLDRSLYARAMEMEQDVPTFASESASGSLATLLKVSDELDEARDMLLTILRSDNDDGAQPFVLSHLPQLELWAGNWDLAEEYAQRHLDAALRTGQHDQVTQARYNLAYVAVHRGDVEDATVVADELERAGIAAGSPWTERNGLGLHGLIAMSRGDAHRAVTVLDRWAALADGMGVRDPGYCRLHADLAEALVATGQLERANSLVRVMTEAAVRLERPGAQGSACRVGALVAAASGDRARAVDLAGEAVALYETTPLVFDRARSLLTLGQVHRRFKEKRSARDMLQAALAEFERLGADGFAQRARLDLARIGLRPASSTSLTETERAVARAAATGRTARQVGDDLFISAKTVEANLTRVYRKLAISGRAELAAWVAAGEPDPSH